MEPGRLALIGVFVFFCGLGIVWAGGWSFEADPFSPRSLLLALGYPTTLAGLALVFYAVVRSER